MFIEHIQLCIYDDINSTAFRCFSYKYECAFNTKQIQLKFLSSSSQSSVTPIHTCTLQLLQHFHYFEKEISFFVFIISSTFNRSFLLISIANMSMITSRVHSESIRNVICVVNAYFFFMVN